MAAPDPSSLPYGPVFSWSRDFGQLVFTSAHACVDVDDQTFHTGDIRQETRLALENLAKTLERAGSALDKVLKVTVYLTDMGDYAVMNEVYAQFFSGQVPARTCIEAQRLPYNFRIVVEAVGHK